MIFGTSNSGPSGPYGTAADAVRNGAVPMEARDLADLDDIELEAFRSGAAEAADHFSFDVQPKW